MTIPANSIVSQIFNLDWLWQDYVLYSHYKTQLKKKVDAFGRAKMDIEKEKMRKILSKKIEDCGRRINGNPQATDYFCDNYNKDESQLLEDVIGAQRKRSLKIISMREHNATKQRYINIKDNRLVIAWKMIMRFLTLAISL